MHSPKLYVGNLNYAVTSQELEQLFAQYGSVVSVKIIERKGFGFVEMSTQSEAEEAKEKLDGTEFMQRRLKVNEAKPQTDQKRKPFNR
jgi:RNA recognition motif-containing protein